MKYPYTQYETATALSMIEEGLRNKSVQTVLYEIALQLRTQILSPLLELEQAGKALNLKSLAMQHSDGDKYLGALLPQYSADYLEQTKEGRLLLMKTIDTCLQNAHTIATVHDFIAVVKCMDGMSFMYDLSETEKQNPYHQSCKEYLAPTVDETAIRVKRPGNFLARTYGIGTEIGVDLVDKTESTCSCLSGKARFFITPTSQRTPIWFEKLADQRSQSKPGLPLIAVPSNTVAKFFMLANGLKLFKQANGLFDFDKAQIVANCFMGYLVYCGHHSMLEVIEIWNRQLDFLAIEYPEQLPPNTIPATPTPPLQKYIEDAQMVEYKLPYASIGDHSSFLHPTYVDRVMQCANTHLTEGLNLSFEESDSACKA